MHLAHCLTPLPHTLVLTVYSHYNGRHPLSHAPDELFQYVLPVLHHHDRHAEVLKLFPHVDRRRVMDQVMLGVLLRACEVRQDGELAWELWEKYQAPQRTAHRRAEEAREQEEKTDKKPGGTTERRIENATLARFVEESLFPHSSYHGVRRSGVSSPTSAFNLLHCTYIVSALRHHPKHANHAVSVLLHMHHHGVRPDSLFYNRVLGTLATKLLPACCLYVLRDMEANNMPIDGRVYYFVIIAHASHGRWMEVVRLIAEMRDRGLDVNEHVYEAAIVCCAETGQVQRARDIVAEMYHRAVPLTWRCYTALITMAGQAGEWQWVLQLFDKGKERVEYCKHVQANDTVIEAFVRAQWSGESTPLRMTAEQVYRRYFPAVIGPRGLWLLMRRGVEAERDLGSVECSADVRQLLTTATTPVSETRIGRMQVQQQWTVKKGKPSRSPRKQQSTAADTRRHYRLFVQNTLVEEAVASVDILLLCMLYQAAHRSNVEPHSSGLEEEEARWRKHLGRLPTCMDMLLCVTPMDTQPPREQASRQQLHDDPIYASTANEPRSREMNGEAEMAMSARESSSQEAAEADAVAAAEHEQSEDEDAGEDEDDTELDTAALSSEAESRVDSDPAAEAVAEVEADLKEKEVELPSLGQFFVQTVNFLLSLFTKPLQRRGMPSSVLEIEPTDTRSVAATAATSTPSLSSQAATSSVSGRTSQPASSALAGVVELPASQADARKNRGLTLLLSLRRHLRRVYGIQARLVHDKGFHRLTLTPRQLTDWVDREMKGRHGRPAERTKQPRADSRQDIRAALRRAQLATRQKRGSGMERASRDVGAQRENTLQPFTQTISVT